MTSFQKIRGNVHLGLMGYGICRAWILEYLYYSKDLSALFPESDIVFRIALVTAAALFMICWSRISAASRLESIAVAALITGIIGASFIAMGIALQTQTYLLAGFAMAGLCGGFFEAKWCLHFLGLSRDSLFANVLLSILLSSVLNILLFLLRPIGLLYLASIAMLIAMAVFNHVARKQLPLNQNLFSPPKGGETSASSPQSNHDETDSKPHFDMHNSSRLFALILASFLYSIVHISGAMLLCKDAAPNSAYLIRAAANFFTIIGLFGYLLIRKVDNPSSLLRAVLLLTTAGLLMQMMSGGSIETVAFFVFCCGNKLFDILLWVLIVEVLTPAPSYAGKGIGGIIAVKNGGCLVGAIASRTVMDMAAHDSANSAGFVSLLVLLLIVTLLWVLSERVLYGRPYSSIEVDNAQEKNPKNFKESFDSAVSSIAAEHGLTPRETDVFACMARGKNRAAIANELTVSRNTVHTHIIHIYQKLGVGNQQELIELVESELR